MAWLKQLGLPWIILSAAAICASCQELTSTLREGNRTCPGEEVFFTCTRTSTSSVFALAWSSTEYIGQSDILQFSTSGIPGAMNQTSSIDENVIAILTNNTNVNGVQILEITLRIIANVASEVTCSGTNGGAVSIEFSISALPGVPQRIDADEISRLADICIILVTWAPANTAGADIDHYIVYIPSRNISVNVSSTISTLHIRNCGDDLRVQVAAVNRVGCVGMNSPAVQPILFDIPTTKGGSAITTSTTVDGSLSGGAIVGITIVGTALVLGVPIAIAVAVLCVLYVKERKRNKGQDFEMEQLNPKVTELKQEQDKQGKQLMSQQEVLKEQQTEVAEIKKTQQKQGQQMDQLMSEQKELKEQQTESLGNTSSPWHVPEGQRHAAKPASHNLHGKGVSGDSKSKPMRKSKSLHLK